MLIARNLWTRSYDIARNLLKAPMILLEIYGSSYDIARHLRKASMILKKKFRYNTVHGDTFPLNKITMKIANEHMCQESTCSAGDGSGQHGQLYLDPPHYLGS